MTAVSEDAIAMLSQLCIVYIAIMLKMFRCVPSKSIKFLCIDISGRSYTDIIVPYSTVYLADLAATMEPKMAA